MREVLAQNVNRLMDQRYKESSNRPLALSKDAGVSLSTVQRTLSREAGASIDTVELFARVFGLPAFQLLVPWGLLGDLARPQEPERPAPRRPLFQGRLRASDARTKTMAKTRRRLAGR